MDEKLLLSLIENNAKLTTTDLAMALNETEENISFELSRLEKKRIICGYHTLINWDRTNNDQVLALIQVKTNSERDYGYDRIAKRIYQFPEVDTMYLLSGNYEFVVFIKGKTMQEVANFVGSKLACVDGVTGTSTLFVLKQYKNNGVCFEDNKDTSKERLVVTP